MQIFLTGTDTNVGKTIIASWLCMHSRYNYWKPIQTGSIISRDTKVIQKLTSATIIKEAYLYRRPLSPHLAASLENEVININNIIVPSNNNLIIEGAGGVLVPLNQKLLMIDLIKSLKVPVILVTRSGLGTINHTLLTIEVLRHRLIPILGVIVNGHENIENNKAIEYYGQIEILASFPQLKHVTSRKLKTIDFPDKLNRIFDSI
ncbi:ATP-dependent dethiobiotin synthetase BioD [Candidatus Trichorickettsia mobilis]|uniref:ATP-dependent dethiobiotin synthetase BioD n=1 Tax=Candidatus Trichorickettsia mobilis TaxID=1346319 RepID=A0ABZ0UT00_9RICK|nr:dethiobiotin synthase [Candidatus Trichorickettsia mobilis]WPY00736.1 ATP-dependent dethiobiotin synthetase BioD [Candidatus Trichorickettsia mobilis]